MAENQNLMKTPALLILLLILSVPAACQEIDQAVTRLDGEIKSGKRSVSDVLSDEKLGYLHPEKAFREMIKSNANTQSVTLVSKNEPGTRITVKGRVKDANGNPYKNALIYVYQTSSEGWYSATSVHIPGNSGDINHARLFAYFRTDASGGFSLRTVKPSGYPKSDLAAHIHIHFTSAENQPLHCTGELQFEDDPRMTPARRKRSVSEGFLISKNSGTAEKPVYEYDIVCD